MGDVAVGARSGHDGEENRGRPEETAGPAPDGPPDSGYGYGYGTEDGRVTGGQNGGTQHEGVGGTPPATPTPAKKQRSFWKELPILIGIALVLALLIKTFLVQAFSIPSSSMENTLQIGDRVLVDKLTPWFGSEPDRGEVVVFHDPDDWLAGEPTPDPNALQTVLSWIGLMPSADEKDLIKRVIGVGGDTVECNKTGPLKVNGKALNEPYVYAGNTPCSEDEQGGQFKVTVPEGKIWVMGDHRQNSRDSRYNQSDKNGGMVPVDEVVGRAIVVAWPMNRWGTLPVPETFDQDGLQARASAAALSVAPQGLAVAGVVPVVWWRRRRRAASAETR
ncbi:MULTISPECIES: signal peptidase I [Streptomyces]|uniref:signal peptidase I n=1 Tax=Streptomyces TaxID=1883 RepID=UPI001CCD0D9E|nr:MULTISPECIES: signal peptidase I [Streptomyces]MCM8551611.1 signal peptidase I [Streptomyces sp. STCH 565 A]MCU8592789.1 signal peptidase I [Streptomyces sp. A13(2022)]UOG79241.1 signal peptidase I [Streptomyces sp. CB09030]WFB85614.1 signal peptidase I [Streptomyces olivaceus]WGK48760.1 signal peptidase I [Streptomyces sp. B146]